MRVGIIGLGVRSAMAEHVQGMGDGVALTAAADPNEAARTRFVETYGPGMFVTADYLELIARDDVDAVFVLTPDHLHEEHAVAALDAGKAVYLEKPMSIDIASCDRILEAARARGGKLYIGHNMRHMSFVQQMKELVDGGAIGEMKAAWCRHFVGYGGDAYFKDWHSERANTTGLLLQKASHDIDVLHWICGGYTRRANAMGGLTLYHLVEDRRAPDEPGNPDFLFENWPPLSQKKLSPVIDVEDLSMMHMALDNGVFASYQQCHYTPDAWRNYTFIGSEGRIENFGDDPPNAEIRLWNRRSGYNGEADERFPVEADSQAHGGSDPRIVREFIDFVRHGVATTTSPVASRYSVAAGYMATRSLREGGIPLDVPPIDPSLAAYFEANTGGVCA